MYECPELFAYNILSITYALENILQFSHFFQVFGKHSWSPLLLPAFCEVVAIWSFRQLRPFLFCAMRIRLSAWSSGKGAGCGGGMGVCEKDS